MILNFAWQNYNNIIYSTWMLMYYISPEIIDMDFTEENIYVELCWICYLYMKQIDIILHDSYSYTKFHGRNVALPEFHARMKHVNTAYQLRKRNWRKKVIIKNRNCQKQILKATYDDNEEIGSKNMKQ